MESDSRIIHFTTSSLNKSQVSHAKNSLNKKLQRSQSQTSKTTQTSVKSGHSIRNEIRSFCCVFSHLTFRSCKFHSVKVFLFLICLISIFTNMITGGYISSIITSLQAQYNLSTAKIGYIIASFDVMGVFATPLISYFGSRYNKARIISICNILFSFGCLVFTLPYFFGARYSLINLSQPQTVSMTQTSSLVNDSGIIDLCKSKNIFEFKNTSSVNLNSSMTRDTKETSVLNDEFMNSTCYRSLVESQWPIYAFIGGQLLMSWGIAPLFPLGITYVCDNLDENRHSIYTGIFYASSALGPAVGYVLGSTFLSIWVNPNEKPPISSNDPRWVGLWYMGFIVAAGFVLIISFILMTFPPKISRSTISSKPKKHHKKRDKNKLQQETLDIDTLPQRQKKVLETIAEQIEPPERETFNFEILDSVSTLGRNCDSVSQTVSSSELSNIGSESNIIPKTTDISKTKKSKIYNVNKKSCHFCRILSLKFKGFLKSFWTLISNLRYSLLVFIMSIECILVAAFTAYMVFYTQHVYQLPSSTASILVGGVIVPSAIIGAVLGGWLVKKFNLNIEGCSNMIVISSILVAGLIVLIFIVRCEGKISDGIDLKTQNFNLSFVCDSGCECKNVYAPTCGVNNVSYLSPCFAGCKTHKKEGYFNCSCITERGNITLDGTLPSALNGACPRKCADKQAIFLVTLFLIVLLESVTLTPITILLLKLVDKPLQAFSLGVARMANILLAYIPAPIVLSYFIDKTCVLWKYDCSGGKGTCLEFNIGDFHFTIFGIILVVKIFSCLLLVIFSAHIHRSFLLKKRFQKKVELNHDITSVLSSKQKYMIDSEVASLESESVSDMTSVVQRSNKRSKNVKPVSENKVILKKYLSNDDISFLSFERSQTPEFFLNN